MEKLDQIFAKYDVSSEMPEKVASGDQKASLDKVRKHLKIRESCEKRALQAVENMLRQGMDGEELISEAPFISQNHFDDAVEERAYVEHLCGYPVCPNVLNDIPAKDVYISGRVNAIFDVKERKKFCSLKCFRAAQFFKQQLESSPVWLRDEETIDKLTNVRLYDEKTPPIRPPLIDDDESPEEEILEPKEPIRSTKLGSRVLSALKKQQTRRTAVDSDDEEPGVRESPVDWPDEVWKSVEEWVTLETGLFLFDGDNGVFLEGLRSWLQEDGKEKPVEIVDKVLGEVSSKLEQLAVYQAGEDEGKKEAAKVGEIDEEMAAKIRAFYSGTMYRLGPEDAKKNEADEDRIPVMCPVLPEKNPVALRRKIFAEKIAKNGMQEMCKLLNIPWLEVVANLLGDCAKTLALTSNNIGLTPNGWKLAAIIMLRLLKHRSTEVAEGWDRLEGAIAVHSTVLIDEEDFLRMDDRLMSIFVKCDEQIQLD